jgi:sugar phosphate isomerase/epimerase
MEDQPITFSVFTKPWKMPLDRLAAFVAGLRFDGIELPVRQGYPLEPQDVAKLPQVTRQLAGQGVRIFSIAGPGEWNIPGGLGGGERTFAACAEAGVPLIRLMAPVAQDGYLASESRLRQGIEQALPLLERYGVTLGIQNHSGRYIAHAMGLRRLVEGFAPKYVAAVWDAAHNALNGEEPELAIDIIWSHLGMVNLKNACWVRSSAADLAHAEWQPYWTNGREGLASWPRVAAELKRRGYRGTICLTAEYSDTESVDRWVAEDLAFARSLFAQ